MSICVIMPDLYPKSESYFQPFGGSLLGFGCSKKQNHDTSTSVMVSTPDPESDIQPFGNSRFSGIVIPLIKKIQYEASHSPTLVE